MTYACTYVNILSLLGCMIPSHLVCKSTILSIDNVKYCVGYAWLHYGVLLSSGIRMYSLSEAIGVLTRSRPISAAWPSGRCEHAHLAIHGLVWLKFGHLTNLRLAMDAASILYSTVVVLPLARLGSLD
jgi:hypothetical protein